MRKYRSHKVVEAGEIIGFDWQEHIAGDWPAGVHNTVTIRATDAASADQVIQVPRDFFARSRPQLGDYLVRYADGYLSWSPKAAFEDGYTAV